MLMVHFFFWNEFLTKDCYLSFGMEKARLISMESEGVCSSKSPHAMWKGMFYLEALKITSNFNSVNNARVVRRFTISKMYVESRN